MTLTHPAPDLRLLRAPNPSPLTGDGTNTYIIGRGQVAVLDPGPDDPAHLDAIMAALDPRDTVAAILVSHAHLDHSPLARPLAARTGAPVMAYGDATAGRSAVMTRLAETGLSGGGEGVDAGFQPDLCLQDGQQVQIGAETLRAIWTPGHMGNHLCFAWRDVVFSGDHVLGWASTLISPPDGDVMAYLSSLDRLAALAPALLFPGHGDPVTTPLARIADLRTHRLAREAQILSALQSPQTIPALVQQLYHDTPAHLHKAAARNVFAHLIALHDRQVVTATPNLSADAVYQMA